MFRELKKGDKCEYQDCENEAEDMVYSRNLKKVIFCCDPHADSVLDEQSPEYWDSCENCGCRQGVN